MAIMVRTTSKWLESMIKTRRKVLEISQYAEIGIDDFFRMPSIRTIELALSGSSENEGLQRKITRRRLGEKIFALSLPACPCACVFLPPTRGGGCGVTPSLSNYDQAYGRPARPGAPVHASAPPFFICERWLAVRRSWRGMSYAFSSPRGIIIFHSLTQQSSRRRHDTGHRRRQQRHRHRRARCEDSDTRTCCHP